MTITVAPFAGSRVEWDTFVRKQRGWTHFHLYGWRGVIEEVFGHECIYLQATDREGLRGILPLVRVRSRLFGHYLVSMPFVNYGGPLGDPDALRSLGEWAVELARSQRVRLLELRSRHEQPLELAVSRRKITVVLSLPDDPAILLSSFKAKIRSQVRRPAREGVAVRFGRDQLDAFYQVFSHHMRDLGTPAQSKDLFTALADEFPDDLWFGAAYLQGQPIAAGCGFEWDGEFEMTWASSLRQYNRIAPNMGLYWSFMERCISRGVRTFNFGRCTPNGGTHRFKRQWGGTDEPLFWYQEGGGGLGGPSHSPSPSDMKYALASRVWRHLPLGMTNRLGPLLVRSIP